MNDGEDVAVPGLDLGPGTPLVLLIVGTDHHRFDRAVRWVDDWARRHRDVQVVAQHGTSVAPRHCAAVPMLPRDTLQALLERSVAAVCHGGPGTIMQVRDVGLVPVVIPRNPVRGEHVDGHQQRFAAVLARRGLVCLAAGREQLDRELERALARPRGRVREGSPAAQAADTFGRLVDALLRSR